MKNRICKISLFSAILASVSALPVDARVNVNSKNAGRSYADAYNQVNALRYQQEYLEATATNATTASATANLPVMVSDEKLASAILSNASETTVAQLENCAMIYPNGVFKWEVPLSGIRQNQLNQCVAVVSLVDANTNAVLATTTLAAGDAMKCNIDSFPESGMNVAALSKTELPADAAPTMADVEAVMNQEQKQNAGIKIATNAIIGAFAGNIFSPKEAGDTKIIGTGKSQLAGSAIGAVAGAGIGAATTYTGKVAGDTIQSAAIDAGAGALLGNMLAGQSGANGFMVVKKCTTPDKKEHDCIVGKVEFEGEPYNAPNEPNGFYIVNLNGTSVKTCNRDASDKNKFTCNSDSTRFLNISVYTSNGQTKPLKDLKDSNGNLKLEFGYSERYAPKGDGVTFTKLQTEESNDNLYFKISSATQTSGNALPAYAVMTNNDLPNKFGGIKVSEWDSKYAAQAHKIMYRNSDGTLGAEVTAKENQKMHFTPNSGSADDGALIDFSNPGRTKGTLTGAAAGGALGGFAGYQGAKSEITDRWTAASREYEDSLSNFVCMTGTRFLSKYNDYVEIPEPNKTDK